MVQGRSIARPPAQRLRKTWRKVGSQEKRSPIDDWFGQRINYPTAIIPGIAIITVKRHKIEQLGLLGTVRSRRPPAPASKKA